MVARFGRSQHEGCPAASEDSSSTKTLGSRATVAAAVVAVATVAVAAGSHPGGNPPADYDLASTATPSPDGPIALAPNAQGYVRVQNETHTIRCSLATDLVACQSSYPTWPRHPDGTLFAAVSITAAGDFQAVDADLGQLAGLVTVQNRTYTTPGWSLSATDAGLRFTNERSGHGMDLGADGVRPF